LNTAGLWLLSTITGPGRNSVQLHYAVAAPTLPGNATGVAIDLAAITYNRHLASSEIFDPLRPGSLPRSERSGWPRGAFGPPLA
jgi:hypothetical protein